MTMYRKKILNPRVGRRVDIGSDHYLLVKTIRGVTKDIRRIKPRKNNITAYNYRTKTSKVRKLIRHKQKTEMMEIHIIGNTERKEVK